jgi:hypothetical protein
MLKSTHRLRREDRKSSANWPPAWAPSGRNDQPIGDKIHCTRGFQGNTLRIHSENPQNLEKLGTCQVFEQQTCGFRHTKMGFDRDEEEKQN